VVFSPNGSRLAAGGLTGLKLWDGATGRELAGLPTRARMVNSVAFSPDGKLLAAGGS
jgi:WD40 repeat protein